MSLPVVPQDSLAWAGPDWQGVPIVLPVVALAASASLVTGRIALYGWSLSASGAAELDLLDGTDAKGEQGPSLVLGAAGSIHNWLGAPGVLFRAGIFGQVVSGTWKGALFVVMSGRGIGGPFQR